MRGDPAVVTGLGAVSAAGSDVAEHRLSLDGAEVQPGPVPVRLFETGLAMPVFALDRDFPGESRSHGLVLAAAMEALAAAGWTREALRNKRVGIALGATVACTFNDANAYWAEGLNPGEASRTPLSRYLGGHLAHFLHRDLGTQGPAAVVTNACSSGTDAIGLALNWLRRGACDVAIAGGVDELSQVALWGFSSLLLTDPDRCRPFDACRAGLNLGEGAGLLVMESDATAAARSAPRRGRVLGHGAAADGHHPTAPHPEGAGLKRAFRAALADAGVAADRIALVNAHGTATPLNDRVEAAALSSLLPDPDAVAVVSTKGLTGHTLGAAGGLEAVFTLMALAEGRVSGTAGLERPDGELPLTPLVAGEKRALTGRVGISQSLAFGGCNGVLVLEGAA